MKLIAKITPPGPPRILNELAKQSGNLGDPLNEIKANLLESVERNFEEQGRPTKWKDLADSTKHARENPPKGRRPTWPGSILNQTGGMASSINGQVDGDSILIGSALTFPNSDKPWVRIHDQGGKAGPGKKITIPKREFLMFQDEDLTEAEEILADHLMGRG